MDLLTKLPSMEDSALSVLHENARRLEQTGTSAQKAAAAELIPAVEGELADRRAAKAQRLKEAAAARRATKTAKRGAAPIESADGMPRRTAPSA